MSSPTLDYPATPILVNEDFTIFPSDLAAAIEGVYSQAELLRSCSHMEAPPTVISDALRQNSIYLQSKVSDLFKAHKAYRKEIFSLRKKEI